MTVAWNDDPPGSLPRIAANVARMSRTLASEAIARREPSVAMAQQ